MKPFSLFVALTVVLGCGRVGIDERDAQDGAVRPTDGGGMALGSGGNASVVHDAAPACKTTALSTAPLPCAVGDWSHAQLSYKSLCKTSRGGYQAKCSANDAIAYTSGTAETWCFYGLGTGQLVGSLVRDSNGDDCKSFDLHFTLPDTNGCPAVSGGDCGPDAGP